LDEIFEALGVFESEVERRIRENAEDGDTEALFDDTHPIIKQASITPKFVDEASNLEPRNPEIINKLAFVTAKSGDRLKGIELYERSLEIDENDDLTHNAIASLYRSEKAYERAQDHYRKAIEIDDEYAQTFYNYGNLLVDMGEIEEARSMYKRALELQSDFPQAREALLTLGAKE
jgi:tetratricopeptide (TPR) repeat protein